MPDDKARERPWHAMQADEVLGELGTEPSSGLSEDEARKRLEKYGKNQIEQEKGSAFWKRLKAQLTNILILILIVSAVLAAIVGAWLDSAVILAVVIVNTVIGMVQEGKAERAIESIQGMLSPKGTVLRGGEKKEIDAENIVPGDIVLLESGDRVPADLRLLEETQLQTDEAVLTGESVASGKSTEPVDEEEELGDRESMAFSSTVVTSGNGVGVVVATGEHTEVGRISTMVAKVKEIKTPLLQQMDDFGKRLSVIIVVVAAITFVVGYVLRDYALVEMFMAALSLAVAAIPEGLPAIMTVTLAIGVRRMASRKAIIRKLPAVETLGSVTTICADKTGTLTRNEMTLKTIAMRYAEYEIEGVGYAPEGKFSREGDAAEPEEDPHLMLLLRGGLLCAEAELVKKDDDWIMSGDPTEGALIVAAAKAGLDQDDEREKHERLAEIPFDSKYKFMATLNHIGDGKGTIFVKGAPDRLLEMSSKEQRKDETAPVSEGRWRERIDEIAGRGQRTLGLAYRKVSEDEKDLDFGDVENDLVFLGLVGMIDPPREGAIEAVDACHSAGIDVKIITGDHKVTAEAVGREMHIRSDEGAMTGRQIEQASDEELASKVEGTRVFARSSPEHKLRLVQALQNRKQVVAMTGDGVNDAPSMKQAEIGIAMGQKGTDAAREVSEMVLADDNFASIANAVEEGRGIYDNLRKTLIFILPTNGGQALTIAIAIAAGLTLPLRPVHVLWVNMIVAVTLALAFAFEPIEKDVMQRKPRPPGTPLLSRFLLWRIAFMSVLLLAGTLGHFLWEFLVADRGLDYARTTAINTLVMGQVFYLFNCRYIVRPTTNREGIFGSRAAWIAVLVLVVLQAAFNFLSPMQAIFDTVLIDWQAWLRILAFGIIVYVLVELEKTVMRRREGS